MDADALSRENAHLKARLAAVEAALAEVQEANRRLEDILRSSQRAQFGKRVNAGPKLAHLAEVKLTHPGDEQAGARGVVT